MSMINSFYLKLRIFLARKDEKGEYSSGYVPSLVRDEFLKFSKQRQGKILEIGCGEGLFIAKLKVENPKLKIFGIDILREGLLMARERIKSQGQYCFNLFEADAQRLCFKDNSFDTVVCLNTLFNLPSLDHVRQTIIEALRVAKIGGQVMVDIRNKKDALTSFRYKFAKLYDSKCSVYLKQYDPQEIISIFQENNSSVLETKPIRAFFNFSTPVTIIRAVKL